MKSVKLKWLMAIAAGFLAASVGFAQAQDEVVDWLKIGERVEYDVLTTTERDALTGLTSGKPTLIYNSTESEFQVSTDGGSTWAEFGAGGGGAGTVDGEALDNVFSSNGILTRTGAETYTVRTITGTSGVITISDGDGVSGNPTIDLADDVTLPGTGAFVPPSGTTAQRPGSPDDGAVRWNTTTSKFELWDGDSWEDPLAAAGGGIASLVDDTTPQLGGDLDTNGNALVIDSHIENSLAGKVLDFTGTASDVNFFRMTGAAAGLHPALRVTGANADIDLDLYSKGDGLVMANDAQVVTLGNDEFSGLTETAPASGDWFVFEDSSNVGVKRKVDWDDIVGGSPAAASATVSGIIELATQAEVDAGTDAVRAVTPDTLANYSGLGEAAASTTVSGIIELATQAEVDAGTDAVRAVTPDTLANYSGLGGGGSSGVHFESPSNTVSAAQDLTTTYATVDGSSVTYTPQFSSSVIVYEIELHYARKDTSVIAHFDMIFDGVSQREIGLTTANSEGTITLTMRCVNSGTGAKVLKVDARDYSSAFEILLHRKFYWNGAASTDVVKPVVTITEYET
jgi:hypothetical protein